MNTWFGLIGYTLTAVGFFVLFLLLLTTRTQRLQRTLLIISTITSSLWAGASAGVIYYALPLHWLLITESIRNCSWLLLLFSTLADCQSIKTIIWVNQKPRWVIFALLCASLAELISIILPWLTLGRIMMLHLIQSAVGLWLVEQLYRRTEKHGRWTVKPLCLGLGLMFAYDFALYANGVLTNTLDPAFWFGRGWVMILTQPLILISSRRVTNWATRVYVSRDVVYHSTLLVVAGIYLLIMAATGYYIRYIGGDWGSMARNIFFALSGLLFASLFISDSLRRQLKVFITKHFYANKYEYRQEWMRFASVLENKQESPYKVALQAIIQPFDCEKGMLVALEADKIKHYAYYNLDEGYPDPESVLKTLVEASIRHQWIIDIEELINGSDETPFIVEPEQIKRITSFSFVVPITNDNGFQCACLISNPHSTQSLNWEDRDLMWAISTQLSVYLNLYQTNKIISENQQFDTFNRMSAFLAHDLKNVLAQLQLLAKNGKQHRDNPEFIDDAFETIDSAITRLTKVVEHLRRKNQQESITANETFSIDSVIQSVCNSRRANKPVPEYVSHCLEPIFITADKERFSNVLSHIIQNAQEATSAEGSVFVEATKDEKYCTIKITDNGIGMSAEFIEERLFKPFDTTKGNSGMGIGAYDAKRLIEQLQGYIDVQSEPGKGSCFTMRIPIPS
ncbi:XrtA/PEP-CTERM system histidine kinase PrsK [Vibrio ziniensis]|uniref:histidine kinase n=1 Tax=Vibrio ziniensis TaxID=2711221 RepID=A0A6G7CMH6_9VIBR|nr:XrtA/PEP-CTERM system histidine kinase PrsK [Vibrio ziniensis]QIH43312.1 PEP-CTERM system histidine kinase PrsK [Vibrio ziniensis]